MFFSLFKGVFRKLLSIVNNCSLVFQPIKGNFPSLPLVRLKAKTTQDYKNQNVTNMQICSTIAKAKNFAVRAWL